jgi:hypothetical protein
MHDAVTISWNRLRTQIELMERQWLAASGLELVKSNVSTLISLCASMPRKTAASIEADDGQGNSDNTERLSKSDQQKVANAIMLWLATVSNRNIVMGSSGSAQNQGGMNGRANVVSKATGFCMMAKFVLEMCGVKITSDQAEGKFRYMLGKFKAANAYSRSSSAGLEESDFAKGIRSLPQKLESMCPQFEVWQSYFGHLQKFNPTSVLSNSVLEFGEDDESNAGSDDGDREEFIESQLFTGSDANIDSQVEDEANAVGDHPHQSSGISDTSEAPRTPQVRANFQSGPGSGGSASAGGGGVGAARVASRKDKNNAAQQLTTARDALNQAVSMVPGSGLSASRSGSGSFEATYASVKTSISRDQISSQNSISRDQISSQTSIARENNETLVKIEEAKLITAQEIQRREQKFQAQLNAINVLAAEQRDKDERRVKQKIEFQNNVTQLLIKDPSGELSKKLIEATQANAANFEDARDSSSLKDLLSTFLGAYAPRRD